MRMCDEHIHRLPAARGGVHVGMIARHDLLKVMLRPEPRPEATQPAGACT